MSNVAEMLEENEEETVVSAPKVTRMCKGQMPSPLVWYIKFHESGDNRSAIASKYFTTSGKVSDIQTNANQRYIVEDMTFTGEELDAAAEKIRENFVRGQEDNANGIAVSPRQLATTEPGDEDYSLEVIEIIRSMTTGDEAVTLEEARAAYNEANPRKTKAAVEDSDEDDDEDSLLD